MVVTGAFLAEHASTVDNSLSVTGGGVTKITRPPGTPVTLFLVVLTRTDGDDIDCLNVELSGPDGRETTIELPVPAMPKERETGFAHWPLSLGDIPDGRHVFALGDKIFPLNVMSA